MNNLIHLNPLDPIFSEYEAFVDKSAGLKTIAFKYFGADIYKAMDYLEINLAKEPIETPFRDLDENTNYYQPELLH